MKRAVIAAVLLSFPLVAMGAIKAEPSPDLRPPRPELPPPLIARSHSAWVLGGLGVAMILVALCWPRRKPPLPPPDPLAVAQEKLAALRADAASATPVAVSAIVRRYAADAFGLAGSALTTEEAVSGLVARRSCPVELTNSVWRFLSDCDLAKFSPRAEPPDAPALVGSAARLIDDLEAARAKAARTL
ncbi:MAG: hypothetical protein ABI318_06740 [Chthoniobacteraceae bacterium]